MNRISQSNPSYRYLSVILIILLLLSLIPLLYLGIYDAPGGDDYSYGAEAHLAFVHSQSVPAAVRAAWEQVRSSYYGWQGTWSAIFLMSLQPAVFGFSLYRVTPFLMLGMLLLGLFTLCIRLFSEVFGTDRKLGICTAAAISIICIQLLPSPVQGFYWFNGSIYYTFFQGMAFLSFGLMISVIQRNRIWSLILLVLLEILIGGGNFATALCSGIVLVGVFLIFLILKRPEWKRLCVPLGALLASFLSSVLAPGNAYREWTAEMWESPMGAGEAILASFRAGAENTVAWLSFPLVGILILLAVLFWLQTPSSSFYFPLPGLVSLYSYCLFSAMFCPSFYAMGHIGPLRMINILWYAYVVLLVLNLYYWIGWISQKRKALGRTYPRWIIPAASAVCLAGFVLYLLTGGTYSSAAALGALRSGEASEYYHAAEMRDEYLKTADSSEVELDPYPCTPYMLYTGDLSVDPDFYVNQDVAFFYGKDRVVIKNQNMEDLPS